MSWLQDSKGNTKSLILSIQTPLADPNSYDCGTVRYGKLSFVDLAGSERVRNSPLTTHTSQLAHRPQFL